MPRNKSTLPPVPKNLMFMALAHNALNDTEKNKEKIEHIAANIQALADGFKKFESYVDEKLKKLPILTPADVAMIVSPLIPQPLSYADVVSIVSELLPVSPKSLTEEDVFRVLKDNMPKIPDITALLKEMRDSFDQEIKDLKKRDPVIKEVTKEVVKEVTKKQKIGDIEGLEQTLSALNTQLSRGYLHGGGVPSLAAGLNITLTPRSDGGFSVAYPTSSVVIFLTEADPVVVSHTSLTNPGITTVCNILLGDNVNMGAPSAGVDTKKLRFRIRQSSGGHTINWASGAGGYRFPGGTAPALSTTAGSLDHFGFEYTEQDNRWDLLAYTLGFN